MSHSPTRDQLVTLANNSASDPSGFLDGLSEIHNAWHTESLRTYGFLLFHHRVVRYFKTIVGPQVQPAMTGFTDQQLTKMEVQPFGGATAGVDALGELASFSSSIESWHNTAHMRIGMATGVPMMDPRQNIFFRPFWQLHFYIDSFFETVLKQYADNAHPNQFVTPESVTGHIEASHHGWVPRI